MARKKELSKIENQMSTPFLEVSLNNVLTGLWMPRRNPQKIAKKLNLAIHKTNISDPALGIIKKTSIACIHDIEAIS